MRKLFIDIETYSSVDIGECGVYKYVESDDYEILIVGYAFDDGPVNIIDMALGDKLPEDFVRALMDKNVLKVAHNASFERLGFRKIGYDVPAEQWYCTMVKAAYCGLPLSLDNVSKVLDLNDKKQSVGKTLIRYFSCPVSPTKTNGFRTRNYPQHAPDKWEMYKEYNMYDVLSEREIYNLLDGIDIPSSERKAYVLDQKINDQGVLLDIDLASSAVRINEEYTEKHTKRAKELTGLENPNSVDQLKKWIGSKTLVRLSTLGKADVDSLISRFKNFPDVVEMLEIRKKLSKTSIAKYSKMLDCACSDNRGRGFFQFYGANRTGRWAGRLLQLQNLSKNHEEDINTPREMVKQGDCEMVEMMYGDVPDILSQLVRTGLVAPEGMTFSVADFSAIEARVISWLAKSNWRLDVFKGDGKIYEATASRMFGVPIDQIKKGSELRAKGKVSELALGYGGGVAALQRMGGDKMGYSESEMREMVYKWRDANPEIVTMWNKIEDAFYKAGVEGREFYACNNRLRFFRSDRMSTDGRVVGNYTFIKLPSGRCLTYVDVDYDSVDGLVYMGMNQTTHKWETQKTYGGKLTENIIQAIARDVLVNSMFNMEKGGFVPVSHVHDEVICEVPNETAKTSFDTMCRLMSIAPDWAADMPLRADGYLTPYYIKD